MFVRSLFPSKDGRKIRQSLVGYESISLLSILAVSTGPQENLTQSKKFSSKVRVAGKSHEFEPKKTSKKEATLIASRVFRELLTEDFFVTTLASTDIATSELSSNEDEDGAGWSSHGVTAST